jgi:hypothetical protein
LQEQVNGYLSLGEKPPPTLVAASNCAKLFAAGPGHNAELGGGDGGDDGTAESPTWFATGRSLAGRRLEGSARGSGGGLPSGAGAGAGAGRITSASTARSKSRLQHKERVFSAVPRREMSGVARWANRQLDCLEAGAATAAAAAEATGARQWISAGAAGVAAGAGQLPPRTPGGTTSNHHFAYPSWPLDDDVGAAGAGTAARPAAPKGGGGGGGRRPISAQFRMEPQLLSNSMRPGGRAQSSRASHHKAFATGAAKHQSFGETAGGNSFSKIKAGGSPFSPLNSSTPLMPYL